MKVLVTGGAGYIGSITAHQLKKQGFKVVVYDSLENGFKKAVKGLDLVIGKIQDEKLLLKTLKKFNIEAVVHFAAYIQMAESVKKPQKYFQNNTINSFCLFNTLVKAQVKNLVFSSTAGVYGNPQKLPIKESAPKLPTNPYGQSKLMVEQILDWFDRIHQLRSISIRFFNAAGAALDGSLGENHQPETHLIPNLIKSAIQKKPFTLYGTDYPTKDGTCIRDYIHVLDLLEAHILALKALKKGHCTDVFNAGTGKGYSNLQVISMVEKVTGQKIIIKKAPRRHGDAVELVADSTKLKKELKWQPQYSDLKTIVSSAYKYHQKHG